MALTFTFVVFLRTLEVVADHALVHDRLDAKDFQNLGILKQVVMTSQDQDDGAQDHVHDHDGHNDDMIPHFRVGMVLDKVDSCWHRYRCPQVEEILH